MISRGVVVLSIAAAALAATSVAAAVHGPAVTRKAALALVSKTPITVAGRSFASRERVTVRVSLDGRTIARAVVATAAGRFAVRFPKTSADECTRVVATAVGSAGSRAATRKIEIPPACGIAPQP